MIVFSKLEIENDSFNMIKDGFRSYNHLKTLLVHRKFKGLCRETAKINSGI